MKKALLVGINQYSQAPLRGCVNDVKEMREVLTSLFGFASENVRVLTDEGANRQAINVGLAWLAESGNEPSVRVFQFAGHGHFLPDAHGDEADGSDETLVPHDYLQNGFLIDDDLRLIYQKFPPNSNLTLLMDCCHAGTNQRDSAEDIIYRFLPNTFEERKAIAAAKKKFHEEQRKFVMAELKEFSKIRGRDDELEKRIEAAMQKFQKQRFGEYQLREGNVLLAACRSDQSAADAKIDRAYHGAFSFCLVKVLRESQGKITYHDLVQRVGGLLYAHSFQQTPQLEYATGRENTDVFTPFSTSL